MKKRLFILALLAVLFTGLTACTSKGSKNYELNTGLVANQELIEISYTQNERERESCNGQSMD